jgi:hypothetical protein
MREECDCRNGGFKVRAMGFSELAQKYNPDITPESAANMLRRWIAKSPKIQKELQERGYKKHTKVLPPRIVQIITQHFGAP